MYGYWEAGLEVRQRRGAGRIIAGSFPYNTRATIADRGSTRKESIRKGAFDYSITTKRRIEALSGHDFNKPLGNTQTGGLKIVDTDTSLRFEIDAGVIESAPSWVNDTVRAVDMGLATGVSPGFRIPPASAAPNAVRLVPEEGNPGVFIREIHAAVLFELSVVTRAAYAESEVEMRGFPGGASNSRLGVFRWL